MKIDFNFLLSKEKYVPIVGAEYEVAPDVWGTMRYPTVKLQEAVFAKADADNIEDYEVMKMVLTGVEDVEKVDCIVGVPTRVVQDFFTLLSLIVERLNPSLDSSDPSETNESQETQQ